MFFFSRPFCLSVFWRRHRVVTDQVTKLRIKSMFNSDDCRPLTENSGSLSSIKRLRKKGRVGGGVGSGKNVWSRLTGIMELSSDVSVVMRRSHQTTVCRARRKISIFLQLEFCIPPVHLCLASLTFTFKSCASVFLLFTGQNSTDLQPFHDLFADDEPQEQVQLLMRTSLLGHFITMSIYRSRTKTQFQH